MQRSRFDDVCRSASESQPRRGRGRGGCACKEWHLHAGASGASASGAIAQESVAVGGHASVAWRQTRTAEEIV